MAFQLADRVRESNVITGTGNVTLGGTVAGYQSFASHMANGDTTWYAFVDNIANAWEVGLGTWNTGNTLSRTVIGSSNSDALVSFAGNTCDCFMDIPASRANQLNSVAQSSVFGTGADGNLSISSGTTTLTRDTCYNNVTITGTGKIVTAGFRLFVAGTLDISNAGAAAINCNTGVGGNGSGATAGSGGGAYAGGTTPIHGNNGGNGATGATGVGTASAAVTNLISTYTLGGSGGTGGAGGAGSSGAGGTGGTVGTNGTNLILSTPVFPIIFLYQIFAGGVAPSGGGAGAGDGTNLGGGGGGGATCGSTVYIAAATITRGASTATACIQNRGNIGGNGGNSAAGNTGGGGGGGGGPGASVMIVTNQLLGATATNCIDVAGGAGGTGGNGVGTGIGGTGGKGGTSGNYFILNLSTNTLTAGTANSVAGSNGNAGSGTTGGTGGAGGVYQVNL